MRPFTLKLLLLLIPLVSACGDGAADSDAYGHFESDETIISSEATGKILSFLVREGDTITAGQELATVDVAQLELQRAQVEASIAAIYAKQVNPSPQTAVTRQQLSVLDEQIAGLQQQLTNLEKERVRTVNLIRDNAATEQQLDGITGQMAVLQEQIDAQNEQKSVLARQITAQNETIATQNRGMLSEIEPQRKRIEMLDDQIARASIKSPVSGTVLAVYARQGEVTAFGKPLLKMAELSEVYLRAYVSGDQIADVRIGQRVTVRYDGSSEEIKSVTGTVTYVADEAEFTPKTVQTRENRVSLVYAVRIRVANPDGVLKIGMPGEVLFSSGGE